MRIFSKNETSFCSFRSLFIGPMITKRIINRLEDVTGGGVSEDEGMKCNQNSYLFTFSKWKCVFDAKTIYQVISQCVNKCVENHSVDLIRFGQHFYPQKKKTEKARFCKCVCPNSTQTEIQFSFSYLHFVLKMKMHLKLFGLVLNCPQSFCGAQLIKPNTLPTNKMLHTHIFSKIHTFTFDNIFVFNIRSSGGLCGPKGIVEWPIQFVRFTHDSI